uniref:Uncharacterized protein n=1 Tax=Anguilla anguilla TaxID=7936 RepID=A0A0E9S8V8_ANGAN
MNSDLLLMVLTADLFVRQMNNSARGV